MFPSKVWKILINGSHFGVGINSFDNLNLASVFVFNKGIKRSTSGFGFASSMCNNVRSHISLGSLGKHFSLSLLELKKKKSFGHSKTQFGHSGAPADLSDLCENKE